MEKENKMKTDQDDLKKAQHMYNILNPDLQDFMRKEFIEPQLDYEAGLIAKFNELIESDECMHLKYECLIKPLTEIIANESVLKQMREANPLGFDDVYHTHFIEKKNTFRLVQEPIISMAMVFVMRRWH
jgi:hypothetical protein